MPGAQRRLNLGGRGDPDRPSAVPGRPRAQGTGRPHLSEQPPPRAHRPTREKRRGAGGPGGFTGVSLSEGSDRYSQLGEPGAHLGGVHQHRGQNGSGVPWPRAVLTYSGLRETVVSPPHSPSLDGESWEGGSKLEVEGARQREGPA